MENLEFRAWYEDFCDGKWKMGELRSILWNRDAILIEVFSEDHLFIRPFNFILMPSTGVKDIKRTKEYPKGQKIYAGDIVRVSSDDYLRVIEWSEDEASFKARMLPNETDYIAPLYMNEGDFEVVGNIHQNPELLIARKK